MKKLFVFLILFIALKSFGQYPNGIQTIGNDSNVIVPKGALHGRLINRVFADTTAANLQRIKQYPGAQIFTTSDNQFWLRNSTAEVWLSQGGVSGFIWDSIYVYNLINTKLTSSDTVGLWQAQGRYEVYFTRINDSVTSETYSDSSIVYDTSRIAFTQTNIDYITNIFNYIDSLNRDTTFIVSPTNLQNGLPFMYSTIDPVSDNDTIHNNNPLNNVAHDSIWNVNENGDVFMERKLNAIAGTNVTITGTYPNLTFNATGGGGGAIGNIGTGHRIVTTSGTNAKTLFPGIGIAIDSTSNTNGLTFKLDTTFGKKYFTYGLLVPNDSTVKLDSTIAVTFDHPRDPYTIFGNNTALYANPTFFTNHFSDSMRRLGGSLNVQRRVNGDWITQYTDSVGSGGGGGGGLNIYNSDSSLAGNRTVTFNGKSLTFTGNGPTAAGATVKSFLLTTTQTATANNDSLFAFYIAPTYTIGAFTGVKYYDIGTANDISIFGVRAGRGGGAVSSNTVFGRGAMAATSTNANNSAFGLNALAASKGGANNSAFGADAGKAITAGTGNVAIGNSALAADTSGSSNVAVGISALAASTTGSFNTAVGALAMQSYNITTATGNNTAVGYSANKVNVTGTGNTAVGSEALLANTTSSNTAFGYQAGLAITSGYYNTAIGLQSLVTNQTSLENAAFGFNSLYSTTGTGNTGLGTYSGRAASTGSSNIFIGKHAGRYATTQSNQIFLSSLDHATYVRDQTESALYFVQNATPNSQTGTLNGKMGIFNWSPTAYLHLPPNTGVAQTAPIKLTYTSIATTAATGNGSTATLTFAAQTIPPFIVGSTMVVAGVTPAGYNATAVVTACTTTTVSYTNATSGAQTVAGTIIQGQLMATPEAGAIEYDGVHFYGTDNTGTRRQLDN